MFIFVSDEYSDEANVVNVSESNDNNGVVITEETYENEATADYEGAQAEVQHGEDEYNNYDHERYSEEEHYVDERGIEEAMKELNYEGDVEVIFEKPAVAQILEGSDPEQYDGVVQLHNRYKASVDEYVCYIVVSTEEFMQLYDAEITNDMTVSVSGWF